MLFLIICMGINENKGIESKLSIGGVKWHLRIISNINQIVVRFFMLIFALVMICYAFPEFLTIS